MSRDSVSDYDEQNTARCERALVILLGEGGSRPRKFSITELCGVQIIAAQGVGKCPTKTLLTRLLQLMIMDRATGHKMGAASENRTPDLLITSETLCRLS